MSEIELKPCPFCAEVARILPSWKNTHSVYWIRCVGCEAETQGFVNINDAVKAWNRRCTDEQ